MHAQDARHRGRFTYLSIVLAGLVVGCDGKSKESDAVVSGDPKAGTRRKEMLEYMKAQKAPSPGGSPATTRNHP